MFSRRGIFSENGISVAQINEFARAAVSVEMRETAGFLLFIPPSLHRAATFRRGSAVAGHGFGIYVVYVQECEYLVKYFAIYLT